MGGGGEGEEVREGVSAVTRVFEMHIRKEGMEGGGGCGSCRWDGCSE